MTKILIVADIKEGVLKNRTTELLSKAASLGAETAVVAIGSNMELLISDLVKAGSDRQYIAESKELALFSAGPYAACVADAAGQYGADQVWFSASESGKAMAPRVAVQLNAACVSEFTAIVQDGDRVEIMRPAIAGKVMEKVKINAKQLVAVVRAGAFKSMEPASGIENVTMLAVPSTDLKALIKEIVTEASGDMDLAEADIVVSVGRGAKDQTGVDLVKGLADDLQAGFGASRAMVDNGLMGHHKQVGQTGKIIAPTLYMAFGISGAIQHLSGITGSKIILAVNKDPEAPIFNISDYGIVGDLFEVVPLLRDEIKRIRKN